MHVQFWRVLIMLKADPSPFLCSRAVVHVPPSYPSSDSTWLNCAAPLLTLIPLHHKLESSVRTEDASLLECDCWWPGSSWHFQDHTAFIFRVQQSFFDCCLSLKMKVIQSFPVLWHSPLIKHCCITEDKNLLKNHCKNLKSCKLEKSHSSTCTMHIWHFWYSV